MEHNPTQAKERLRGLEADASAMMQELGRLSAKLREVNGETLTELGKEAVEQLGGQVDALRKKVQGLGADSEKLLATVDKSVRSNPYLYILGALGLGVLLGKILRS